MIRSIFAAALCTILVTPVGVRAQDAATVVARVGDQEITLGQMLVMRESLPPETAAMPPAALWDLLLDQLVRQAAMADGASDNLTARDKAALAVQRRAYLAASKMEKIAAPEPSDDELKAAYEAAYGSDGIQTEYHAAHILLETEEAAKAAIVELSEGADFGQLAKELSVGPSAPKGGDLGWFTSKAMVAPFAEAVAKMTPDSISETPVKTDYGWHVINLIETRETKPPKLDEVRAQLITQIRRQRLDDEIAKVMEGAKVEKTEGISPDLLANDALLEGK